VAAEEVAAEAAEVAVMMAIALLVKSLRVTSATARCPI
jgi:hypothetical protein